MNQKEVRDINCPRCGAPYRKFVPQNTLQLKCEYCGATFVMPPRLGVEVQPCPNHPDRFTAGKCNDCGRDFCQDCLSVYKLASEHAKASLYLCPLCRRKREMDKAHGEILVGFAWLMMGAFITLVFPPMGIVFVVLGAIFLVYGIIKKSEVSQEFPAVGEPVSHEPALEEEKEPGQEPTLEEIEQAEELYETLRADYVEHYGVVRGLEVLDNEIKAYTWHGSSYSEAIRKVYRRQRREPL